MVSTDTAFPRGSYRDTDTADHSSQPSTRRLHGFVTDCTHGVLTIPKVRQAFHWSSRPANQFGARHQAMDKLFVGRAGSGLWHYLWNSCGTGIASPRDSFHRSMDEAGKTRCNQTGLAQPNWRCLALFFRKKSLLQSSISTRRCNIFSLLHWHAYPQPKDHAV